MLEEYLSVLLFILMGIGVGVMPIILNRLVAPNKPDPEKNSPYECGFPPFENARIKFSVKYYLIAIFFIIFDLEIAFLFPWALIIRDLGLSAVIAAVIFLGLLVVGFIYEWKKGALEWE